MRVEHSTSDYQWKLRKEIWTTYSPLTTAGVTITITPYSPLTTAEVAITITHACYLACTEYFFSFILCEIPSQPRPKTRNFKILKPRNSQNSDSTEEQWVVERNRKIVWLWEKLKSSRLSVVNAPKHRRRARKRWTPWPLSLDLIASWPCLGKFSESHASE